MIAGSIPNEGLTSKSGINLPHDFLPHRSRPSMSSDSSIATSTSHLPEDIFRGLQSAVNPRFGEDGIDPLDIGLETSETQSFLHTLYEIAQSLITLTSGHAPTECSRGRGDPCGH